MTADRPPLSATAEELLSSLVGGSAGVAEVQEILRALLEEHPDAAVHAAGQFDLTALGVAASTVPLA